MARQEVRPGVVIAYEDQWFGPPWQDGEPIILLHGVAESHVSWQQWVPLLSGRFREFGQTCLGLGNPRYQPATSAQRVRSLPT